MSENRQFVENPLHLVDLFAKGLFYFPKELIGEVGNLQRIDSELDMSTNNQGIATSEVVDASVIGAMKEMGILPMNEQNAQEMTTLTLINLFLDLVDVEWSDDVEQSYRKLMSVVQVNQTTVIAEDIEKIIATDTREFSTLLLGDRISPVIFVWSDHEINGVPSLFKARPTEKGVVMRFPAFTTMVNDLELKKRVWMTMKQVLKF